MANFGKEGTPGSFGRVQANPASPMGLAQTASRFEGEQQAFGETGSGLRPWLPETSYLETAKSWYAGQNTEGTENGWDSTFYKQMWNQRDAWVDKAAQANEGKGSPSTFFQWLNPNINKAGPGNQGATGVATWDDPNVKFETTQGQKALSFGDVFNNGQWVGNVYQDYDEATADVMMGDILGITNDVKERVFADPDRNARYRTIVQEQREANTEQAKYAPTAEAFRTGYEGREEDLQSATGVTALTTAGAVATGAMAWGTAATVASSWLGPFAVPIGIGAAVVGGAAAWLNQDQLIEMTAKGMEKVDQANQNYGAIQATAVGLSELGAVGTKLISPVSNTYQGIYDSRHGKVGDMTSEFYEVDPTTGRRQASGIAQAGDIISTAADFGLQFSSAPGRQLFMGTMGLTTAGGAGEVGASIFTQAGRFNESRGTYDKYENWQEWSAAVANVGIDAVQMGTAGLLGKAAASSRAAFGAEAEVLAGREVTVTGVKYQLDDQGKAISAKFTLEALAPSEFLKWVPNSFRARMMRDVDSGLPIYDDLYRASLELSKGGSTFRDAIINGYAEGGEEAFQAIFERAQFGETATPGEIAQAALYGAAGGFGMGMGAMNQKAQTNQIQEKRARTLMTMRQGRKYTDEEWAGVYGRASQADKDQMAIATPAELERVVKHMEDLQTMHSYDAAFASTIGAMAGHDLKLSAHEKGNAKSNAEGEGSLALYGAVNEYAVLPDGSIGKNKLKANSVNMTAWETINQLLGINEGLKAQLSNIFEERTKLQGQVKNWTEAKGKTADQDTIDNLQHKIDVATQQLAGLDERELDLAFQNEMSDSLLEKFNDLYNQLRSKTTEADVRNLSDFMNRLLERAFNGQWEGNDGQLVDAKRQEAIQRAVQWKSGRHPFIDTGSLAVLMPQISIGMTRLDMHGAAYVHQASLKVAGADHDGDTVVPQHGVYLPPAQLQAFLRGNQYVETVEVQKDDPELGYRKGEVVHQVVVNPPDNELAYLRVINDSLNDMTGERHLAVKDELEKLDTAFMNQYARSRGGPLEDEDVERALREFRASAYAGLPDARINLANRLFNIDAAALFQMADDPKKEGPQLLWMMHRINRAWDGISKRVSHYEAVNPEHTFISSEEQRLPVDNRHQEEKARLDAYNAGQVLSMAGTNAPVRAGQTTHYSALFNSATYVPDPQGAHDYTGDMHDALVELYENLGSGKTQSDIDQITGKHSIEERVQIWLTKIAEDLKRDSTKTTPEILMLVANLRVPNVKKEFDRHVVIEGEITMLQLLLQKSLDIEENIQRKAEPESDVKKKIASLRRLTQPQSTHSYSASKAVLEVFGNYQLYQLLGDSSMYIAPQMTLNQLMKQLAGHSKRVRGQMLHRLERSPVYFSHNKMGDPPWSAEVLVNGEMNAFTMLLDAARVGAQTEEKNMERSEEAASEGFRQGLKELHNAMDAWREYQGDSLTATDGKISDQTVLLDLLENRPEFTQKIVDIIPDVSKMGVFRLVEGQMHVATWVQEMLLNRDTKKAELDYWIHSKFAEFNARGGMVDYNKDGQAENAAGTVRYGSLQSRFLQSVYQMAQRPGGFDLSNMIDAAKNSASLEEFMEKFNSTAAWRGPRADLLPYHDDVALYEADPRDVWNQNLPSSIQRENLVTWGQQLAIRSAIVVEATANKADNFTLLEGMHAELHPAQSSGILDPQTRSHDGYGTFVDLLEKTIENRKRMPDVQGQAARNQITQLLQEALVRMHDKGSADPRARAWGEAMVTVDSFGWRDGLSLEVNALTALDFEDIRVNPTLLVDGPIRAMLSNGAMVEIDLSTKEGALAMLRDPRTQALAIAVLFPTVRDVNNQNILQTYLDVDNTGSIAKMLEEANMGHLFDEMGTKGERVKQAHRYIGYIEAHIRKAATKLPKDERAAMFAPIQNMINDFITAYTHGPKSQHMNHDTLRDDLMIDVMEAIKAVAATNELSRDTLRRTVLATLETRYLQSTRSMDRMLRGDVEQQILDNGLRAHLTTWYAEEFAKLDAEEDAATTQQELDVVHAKLDDLNDVMERMNGKESPLLPTDVYLSLSRVTNMFTLSSDFEAASMQKQEMLAYIGGMNRMNRFRDKGAPLELIRKLRRAVWLDRMNLIKPDTLTESEWEMLGKWCIQLYISDAAVRTGSSVALNPVVLGEKGNQVSKYFDMTYGYLVDTLFDENVLEAADFLAKRDNYNIQHNSSDTAKVLESGLFNQDKLGQWTDRIPVESLKARTVLLNAPVGAAVALGGNLPKEMFDAMGSSVYTFKMPDETKHHTQVSFFGPAGSNVEAILSPTPLAYIKLQNHFMKSMVLTAADGTTWDLYDSIGITNNTHELVENSGYRVIDLTRLDRAIRELQETGQLMGDFKIDIDYVDVDKNPGTLEYANNVFFDGVGRDAVSGASLSAIAALYFGINGISKLSQQNPLDMAAKAGKAFMQYIASALGVAKNFETVGKTITEQMGEKAMHLWKQEYDTGLLQAGDLPSLYKVVKMRHVVKGKLPGTGEIVFWWPEQAMSYEANGVAIPLTDIQVIPLSDSVAQTLRGGGGQMGVKGAMTMPVLNLQDMDPLPDLGTVRLKELGITHLGETVEPGNSPFAHIAAPPKATMSPDKGAAIHTRYMERTERWRGDSVPYLHKRSKERGTIKGSLNITEYNERNAKRINELLTYENMGPLLMRRGIPHASLLDPSAVKTSSALAAQIENVMEDDNNIIWELVHGKGANPSAGVLSIADLRASFANPDTRTPMFGDVVVLNLSSLMEGNGQKLTEAYKQGKEVIRMLSDHGVTVVLGTQTGDFKLRNDLGAWMKSGNLGYRQMGRSPNFFTPILTGEEYGITRDALESVLTETRHYSARHLELNIVSDLPGTDVQENMARIDTKHSRAWKRITHTILPTAIDGTGDQGSGNQYSYNIPVAGIGDTDQRSIITDALLKLLKNEDGTPNKEGRKHLAQLASNQLNGDGNPTKISRWYRKNKNGTTDPGVLKFEEALNKLQKSLESGKFPTDVGQTIHTGTLIPLAGADGSILLARAGFRLPDMAQMSDQLNAPMGQLKHVDGERGVRIAIATDAIDKMQTLPPPFEVEAHVQDEKGLSVRGTYQQGILSKLIFEGLGFKAGLMALGEKLKFHDTPMAPNGTRPTIISSSESIYGKQATNRIADNFSVGFAVTGIDFTEMMVDLFYGRSTVKRSEKDYADKWNSVRRILDEWAEQDAPFSADDIARSLDVKTAARAFVTEINAIGAKWDSGWTRLELEQDPTQAPDPLKDLGTIIIATLAIPGVRVNDVISASGLMSLASRDSDAKITELPQVMTMAMMNTPSVHQMMIGEMNSRFPRDAKGKLLYYFEPDFTFHARMQEQDKHGNWVDRDIKGDLQIVLPIAADENAIGLTQAALTTTTEVSPHIAATVSSAFGGRTTTRPEKPLKPGEQRLPSRLEEVFGENKIMRFDEGTGETFWTMMHATMDEDPTYVPWEHALPMEEIHLDETDKKVHAYTTPIDRTPAGKDPWTKEELIATADVADELLSDLNLDTADGRERIEVDYLVRQFVGRPGRLADQKDWNEVITPEIYIEVVGYMRDNIAKNLHPLHGGAVPLEHMAFWQKVFFAQRGLAEGDKWAPAKLVKGKRMDVAETWNEWCVTLIGQMRDSNKPFHSMFRQDLDGFWLTYQGASPSFQTQMFSTDELIAMKLMDKETNEAYLSVSPGQRALMSSPVILDSMRMTYKALAGHPTSASSEAARTVQTSEIARQLSQQKKWLDGQKLTAQRDMSVKEYMREGSRYTDSTRHTSALLRGAVNASITNRLFNPQLYFSAIFEVPFRSALEHATNILTGGNISVGGKATARLSESFANAQQALAAGETPAIGKEGGRIRRAAGAVVKPGTKRQQIFSGIAELAPGVEAKFTPEQVTALNRLAKDLGSNNKFLGELYGEMIYTRFVQAGGESKLGSFFEWSAQAVARMTSDPHWGMKAPSIGKRYIEAAWEYLSITDSLITVPQFIELLERDPLWLKNNAPDGKALSAHRMGVNRVAQTRSTKQSVPAAILMGGIDSMTDSSSTAVNWAGHLLKIPFQFTRFNINAFITLTGLGGLDQMAAMMLSGRKPAIFQRMKALAQKDLHPDLTEVEPMNFIEVIEGLDLSRAFVRGAVTQTGFMALGMMAGGMGLGGEDEEERRRRRLAKYLHVPYLSDPRKAANDFLWADAIFLDEVPVLGAIFKDDTGHSAVVPHWIMRQFLSPIMGMTRFFETGDVREIGYGFWDAAAAMPNSVIRLWKEADLTAKLLADAAKDVPGADAEAAAHKNQLLINIVGVYEKALIENSFVNSLINAQDDFDRNPWMVPKTADENTGELDRLQGTNLPQQSPALQTFNAPGTPGETGLTDETKQAYLTRSGWDARLHSWTENNHTASVLASLFTGQLFSGNSTYSRNNMVPVEQKVRLEPSTQDEVESLILSAWAGKGGQPFMTKDEIVRKLQKRDTDAGIWWDMSKLEKEADGIYASQQGDAALSLMDPGNKEVITQAGMDGVYQALWSGAMDFDHPSLQGVSATWEMRDNIAEEWLTRLTQEGVDYGLTETAAKYRTNRIWWGSKEDPDMPGLRELLYDKRIPVKNEAHYYQQNTTYAIGPDGRPWATPFQRMNTLQALGIPMPHQIRDAIPGQTALDERGNVIDLVRGINTGMAAIVPIPEEPQEPNDKPLEKALAKEYSPGGGSGRRFKPFKRFGRSYGGGGGGGSDYGPPFIRMNPLPDAQAPRYDNIPMINTNTPYIRRATIHRERIQGERGRLKQWQ